MAMFEKKKRYALLAAGISMMGCASAASASTDPQVGVQEAATKSPASDLAPIQRGVLSNGVEVMVKERRTAPGVIVQLLFDAGNAADLGRKPGTAGFTISALMTGMKLKGAGAHPGVSGHGYCSLDSCVVGFYAADAASMPLARFAQGVRNPEFAAEDIEQIRSRRLESLVKDSTLPVSIAWDLMYPMLYGADHAYASFSGKGSRESIVSMDVEDLMAFRKAYVRPDNVKILVTGNTSLAQILPQLEAAFGDWMPDATDMAETTVRPVAAQANPRIVLVNRPGATQSFVMGGFLAPPGTSAQLRVAVAAFAQSRLSSHGAGSFVQASRGQSPLFIQATVGSDDTARTVNAIHREVMDVVGARPLSDGEIESARQQVANVLAGPIDVTTDRELLETVANQGLPDDYWQTFKRDVAKVDRAAAGAALTNVLRPDAMNLVIVGDVSRIEGPIRALNIGEVSVVDYDGAAVQQ